ncbi:hypothetical protein ACIO1C_00125 [Streptomyces sp. NPDC087420]|uniref:hypothetical protein n=1 Tax=Streptomyces sp. NPDC087420 TaxID=3365785 RepID=UPI003834FF35
MTIWDAGRAAEFGRAIEHVPAAGPPAEPYGHGRTPVKADADRREATIGGVVVRSSISAVVLMMTVVRVVHISQIGRRRFRPVRPDHLCLCANGW